MEYKCFEANFKLKSIEEEPDGFFRFSGMASTFEKDLVDDVIEKGAFKESISKQKPVILFQHDHEMPIGVTDFIQETENGLSIEGRLPKDDSLVSGRIIPQMKVGSLSKLSIGFRMNRDDFEMKNGVRHIKKVDLPEVSIVTFPANTGAKITGFKSIGASTDLPISNADVEWNEQAAIKRIREKTNSLSSPSEEYKKAFLWHDPNDTENFDAYRLPFTDIIEDELFVIPNALDSAKEILSEDINIPTKFRSTIKSVIDSYSKNIIKVNVSDANVENITKQEIECNAYKIDIDKVENIKTKEDFENILIDSNMCSKNAASHLASFFTIKDESQDVKNEVECGEKSIDKLDEVILNLSLSSCLNNLK